MITLSGNFKPAAVHRRGSLASKQLSDQAIATLSKPQVLQTIKHYNPIEILTNNIAKSKMCTCVDDILIIGDRVDCKWTGNFSKAITGNNKAMLMGADIKLSI